MESEREQSHLGDLDNSGEGGGAKAKKAKKAVVEESPKSRREDVAVSSGRDRTRMPDSFGKDGGPTSPGSPGPLSPHCACTSSTAVQLETFQMFVSSCTCISISFYY
jgi:hypothetical protein